MTEVVLGAAVGLGAMFGLQSRLLHIQPFRYLIGVVTQPGEISTAIQRLTPAARVAFNLALAGQVGFGLMVLTVLVGRLL